MKIFLEAFMITAEEAQVIMEVCRSRDYYMDVTKLQRKMPKTFSGSSSPDLKKMLNGLVQKRYLQPYAAKKDEFCVRSAPLGRDFVASALREGLDSFEDWPKLESEFDQMKLMCYDPCGFKKGEIRWARSASGDRIKIEIIDITASDEVYRSLDDGKTIYAIRLIGSMQCPRCPNIISIDYSYTDETCYKDFIDEHCKKCGLVIMLACSLATYYTLN
jgi:hypothetical protein